MFNITAVGRLTADPELRYTPGGTALCNFSLATNRYAGKEKGQVTDYADITVWGPMAETHEKQLGKGHQVAIAGELIQERWEKDGKKFSKHSITASNVEYMSKPRNESSEDADAEMANA